MLSYRLYAQGPGKSCVKKNNEVLLLLFERVHSATERYQTVRNAC